MESEFKLKCCFSSLEALPGRKLKGQLTFLSLFSGLAGVELGGPSSPVLGEAWAGVEAAGWGAREDATQRGGQVGTGTGRAGAVSLTEPQSGAAVPRLGVMARRSECGRGEVETSELGWRGAGGDRHPGRREGARQ